MQTSSSSGAGAVLFTLDAQAALAQLSERHQVRLQEDLHWVGQERLGRGRRQLHTAGLCVQVRWQAERLWVEG